MSRCRPTCVSVVRSRSSTRRASDVQPPRLSVAAVDRTARLRRRWKNWWSPWPGQRPTTPSPFKSRYNINPRLTIVTRFRFAQMEWTMGSWFPGQYFVTSHFCWGSVYSQQLRRQRWVYSPVHTGVEVDFLSSAQCCTATKSRLRLGCQCGRVSFPFSHFHFLRFLYIFPLPFPLSSSRRLHPFIQLWGSAEYWQFSKRMAWTVEAGSQTLYCRFTMFGVSMNCI